MAESLNHGLNLNMAALCVDGKPLKNLEGNLRVSLDKIKGNVLGGPSDLNVNLSLPEYWKQLVACTEAVCKEANKLFVAFSKPPSPSQEETQALINGVERVVIAVLSTFSAFNRQQGFTLHKVVKTFILDLLNSLLDFVSSLSYEKKEESVKLVGVVWECCRSLSTLPKDAKEAVLREAKSSFDLINDAIAEAEEFCRERSESESPGGEDEDLKRSSDQMDKIRHSSVGLAKVAKATLKKIMKAIGKNAKTDDVTKVNELDAVAQAIEQLSPSVDELFSCLYCTSFNETSMENEGIVLASILEKLLQLCRNVHFCIEEDHTWLDFLAKALDHNLKHLKTQQSS